MGHRHRWSVHGRSGRRGSGAGVSSLQVRGSIAPGISIGGRMRIIERFRRALAAVDGFQQGHPWVSFPYAVAKKFGDDQAGNLAALVAYYGFFSLFPLLLVLAAGLGIVLRGDPQLQRRILDSALGQFPLIGVQLRHDVAALGMAARVPMGIGIVGTLRAGMGVLEAMQNALDTVWGVPYKDRPSALVSSLRALLMLAVLGVMTVVSAILAGLGA